VSLPDIETMSNKDKSPGLVQTRDLTIKTKLGVFKMTFAQKGRMFALEHFELDGNTDRCLAFDAKGVENLDEGSDAWQVFGVSTRVRVDGNVILDNREMRANSFEELEAALRKVKLRTFLPEEI
jgi:hypothetical protein